MKFVLRLFFLGVVATVWGRGTIVAQGQVVLPELHSRRLLNDLQITVASTPALGDSMTIGLVLRYGSAFDPQSKEGLAELTSQMLMKATTDLTSKDIQNELDYLDASIEILNGWDGIRFFLRGHSSRFERSLLLLYQIVGEARFNEDDFVAVKGRWLEQLQASEDPRQRMRSSFEAAIFRGTTYGRPIRGTVSSVGSISVGDVRYFSNRYYSPDQAALVVVGSADPEQVLQKATRIWGVWVRQEEIPFTFLPPRPPATREVFLDDEPGSPAAQFVLGNLWPQREQPAFYAAQLAALILQERLNRALPTSLLTVASEGRRLSGLFYMQGQAAADQAPEEIDKIIEAVDAFKESGVTESELADAQQKWIEEFNQSLKSTDGICKVMLDAELYRLGTNYAATFEDFVRRNSLNSVKEAARSWFFPGGFIILVRGPADQLKAPLELLGPVQQPAH